MANRGVEHGNQEVDQQNVRDQQIDGEQQRDEKASALAARSEVPSV